MELFRVISSKLHKRARGHDFAGPVRWSTSSGRRPTAPWWPARAEPRRKATDLKHASAEGPPTDKLVGEKSSVRKAVLGRGDVAGGTSRLKATGTSEGSAGRLRRFLTGRWARAVATRERWRIMKPGQRKTARRKADGP